jgi:phytoene dehydrogenase-like protein
MLGSWSLRNKWQERVNDQAVIDTNDDLAKWAQRRDEIREADYETGKKIRVLADKILEACPEYILTRELHNNKGEVTTIIKAIDGMLMLKAFDLASELQRIAADLATESIDVKTDGKSLNTIADKLRSDLMDRIKKELETAVSDSSPQDS